jgi:hypothetical protein
MPLTLHPANVPWQPLKACGALEIETYLSVPGPNATGGCDAWVTVDDMGDDGYNIIEVTVPTPDEKEPQQTFGSDHPLFDLLCDCVDRSHIEEVIQAKSEANW